MKEININQKMMLNIIICMISFFATYFIPYIIHFDNELSYSNSVISLVIFGSFIYLLSKTCVKENTDKIKNAWPLGLIFATSLVLGNSIKLQGTIEYGNINIYLAILFISFIIGAILVQIYRLIEKIESRKHKEQIHKLSKNKRLFIVFCIIVISWIPVLLAAYPGYFCYDAETEYLDYIEGHITNWHPPIHTFILGFIVVSIGHLAESYNLGIFIYTALQMIVIAACFTYCIAFLERYKVSKWIKTISVLYYALFPVISMFAICSTKDTIFSAVVLVSIIKAIDALMDKEKFLSSTWEQIKFSIIIFLALILRNNAIYAYVPLLIIFIISFKNKKVLIPIIEIIGLYILYAILIYGIFHVSTSRNAEAFSVPLQQIARVYNYNYDSLTEEEINEIHEYTTHEQIKNYLPECSDLIKRNIYLGDMGYARFLKLWFGIGLKNPRNLY